MSRSLTRLQAVVLGLVILTGVGLASTALFAVGSKHWPWNDHFTLRVSFKDVGGVEVGTRVRVQGVDAGEVSQVEPSTGPGKGVMLTLRLAGKWRERKLLRQDAMAQIVSEGMVGSKVIEIDPGTEKAEPLADNALIESKPTSDITQALGQLSKLIDAVKDQEGRVGELIDNTNRMVRQGHDTLESIQQLSDAAKGAPIVRNYVKDPQGLLVRPECERNQWVLPEASLFESDSARLTSDGQKKLDDVARKVNELKHEGSDVVVVAYADPKSNPTNAATLTQKQSEVVMTYLKDHHNIHKMGWLFSTRPVKALGMGIKPAPFEPGQDNKLPPARVEVLVFVPRKG